ncbi:hypothetical protein CRU96_08615 [Malaciobacter halophilus]|nr:hypothetical protein [Malaciobacter halophilus]RYA23317.1 hypothetical protein CRU96_08615 [Malaciobacter halophilus]
MEKDNPARRLLNVLKKVNTISTNENTKRGWFKLFEIKNQDDEATLFRQLGKLMTLPNIVLDDVKKYHPSHEKVCIRTITVINNAFRKQDLNGQWKSFSQAIREETINYLELISTLLDYEYKMNLLEEDKLLDIRKSVDDLIKDVTNSSLDKEFKIIIIKYLKKIIDSIDEYNIMGIEPIFEALEVTAGHAILNKEFGQKLNESKLTKKFIFIFEKLISLVNSGNSLFQLASNVSNILTK